MRVSNGALLAGECSMRTRIVTVAASVVAVLGALVLAFGRGGPRVQVATTAATTGPIARQVLSTGTLEPARMVEVGAQVSGTIAELRADFNSVVKTNQVIARLDPSLYQSQLEAARGQLAQARAEAAQMQTTLDDAKRKLSRAEELAAQQLITQAELDAARITLQQAAADLKGRQAVIQGAQAIVKQAQVDLDRTVIRSPIDGVIVSRNVDVGQTLAATLQSPVLFTIADLRAMHLLTEVDEGEIAGVGRGAGVSFQVESLGSQTFHGTVVDVRLQPYAQQASAVTGASTTGTAGTPGTSNSTATGTGGTATSGGNSTTTAGSTSTGSGTTSSSNTITTTVNPTAASGSSASSSTAPGAVTYTAVIDVPNQDGRLTPGGTAIVTMSGGARQGVVRLPNNALSFRPSPEMLERTGQKDLAVNSGDGAKASGDPKARVSHVWRFENNKFVPLDVVTGLSDEQWTEMVSGPVQPGDRLVTSAAAAPR
jgi:RND family efflux transporter MFP subunit